MMRAQHTRYSATELVYCWWIFNKRERISYTKCTYNIVQRICIIILRVNVKRPLLACHTWGMSVSKLRIRALNNIFWCGWILYIKICEKKKKLIHVLYLRKIQVINTKIIVSEIWFVKCSTCCFELDWKFYKIHLFKFFNGF